MSSGIPEQGSQISLISKADIRYVGRLFTVDPKECTLALASVRSFGTEDRETQYPVAPQTRIYDYILFRGSDIKDICVVNSASTNSNDPEIKEVSVPATLEQPTHAYQRQTSSRPSVPGPMAPVLEEIDGGATTSRKSPLSVDAVAAVAKNKDDRKPLQRTAPFPNQRSSQSRDWKENRGEHLGEVDQRQNQTQRVHNQQWNASHHQQQQHQHQNQHRNQNNQHYQEQQNFGNRQRGRSGAQGTFRSHQSGQKSRNTLKFDSEYDFEQANTEFEELKNQLGKIKINDAAASTAGIKKKSDKKEDSGKETVKCEQEVYYDKSKSFFDNISCDALERSKGRSQRTDWRAERKLNMETFGVQSTRGGYRGRGNYYNRGNTYRGGYRGNYKGQGQQKQQYQENSSVSTQQPLSVAAAGGK